MLCSSHLPRLRLWFVMGSWQQSGIMGKWFRIYRHEWNRPPPCSKHGCSGSFLFPVSVLNFRVIWYCASFQIICPDVSK